MDEDQEREAEAARGMKADELEALIALVEERVVENLARIIERLAEARERTDR